MLGGGGHMLEQKFLYSFVFFEVFEEHIWTLDKDIVQRQNLRILDRVSGLLRIYVLFSPTSNKIVCFTAVMTWPKPINRQLFAQNDHW